MKRYLGVLLFFFAACVLNARVQKYNADSLENVLKTQKQDTSRVNTLNKLSIAYKNSNREKSISCAKDALELSKALHYNLGLAKAYLQLGVMTMYSEDNNIPKNYLDSAMKYSELSGDKLVKAHTLNSMGILAFNQGNYPHSLELHLQALPIEQSMNDSAGMSNSHVNIGNIYWRQENYTEALKHYTLFLELSRQLGNKGGIAGGLMNIGLVYSNMREDSLALVYYLEAAEMQKQIGDFRYLAYNYINIGSLYEQQGKYDLALEKYRAATTYHEQTGDVDGLAAVYVNMGSVYYSLDKLDSAHKYLDNGLLLARETKNKETIAAAYLNYVHVDSTEGNFSKAYEHHKLYVLYMDSLDNEKNTQQLTELKMQYQFDQEEEKRLAEQALKDAEIAEDNRRRNIVLGCVGGGLLLVLISSAALFSNYRKLRTANVEITHQKEIIEEKQKDILDSINYAKRIQYTLLAHEDLIKGTLPDHFILFQPKDIVSGDFYWATEYKSEGKHLFFLAVCDSTGHGVPGAFMSLMNITFLNEAINEKNILSPEKIFDHVRDRLIAGLSQDGAQDGMDGILLCINKVTGTVTYSGANSAPIIVRGTELVPGNRDKMPVGKGERKEGFTLFTLPVRTGDTVYLYTDGFTDQFGGPSGKKYKYRRLQDKLLSVSHLAVEKQKHILASEFNEWKGDLEQVDDVLVAGIKF